MPQDYAVVEDTWIKEDWALVRLSDTNKDLLLKKSMQIIEQQRWQAIKIVENMTRYNPAVAKNFMFKNAALPKAPLRLLFRRDASIVHNPSHRASSYIIISYCWHHSDEWNSSGLSEVREPWPIQNAFVEDIVQLRESPEEGIWIDQCSIDQHNEEEKSAAVAVMDIIYSSARQLIIILEDIIISHEEEKIINRYWDVVRSATPIENWDVSEVDLLIIRQLLHKILRCRWFTRSWCSHEFRIAKYYLEDFLAQPRFRALNSDGKIIRIPSFLLMGFFHHTYRQQPHDEYFERFKRCFNPSRIQYMRFPALQESLAQKTFVHEFHDTAALGCKEEDDKLQISINLAGLPLYWKGKETDQNQLYWISSLLALAAGDVSVLGFWGPPLLLSGKHGPYYSWARRSFNPMVETKPRMDSVDMRVASATPEALEIDLIFFERPTILPSPRMLGLAIKVLHDTGLRNISKAIRTCHNREELDSDEQSTWMDGITKLLACALQCGLEWIACVGRDLFMEEPFNPSAISMLPRFPDGLDHDSFNKTLQTAAETIITSLLETEVYVTEQVDLDAIINFLATITNPRFHLSGMLRLTTVNLKGDLALVTHIEPGQRLAIPAALTAKNCTSMTRVWLLEEQAKRSDVSAVWRLLDKSYALMSKNLAPDGHCVVEKKRQKVLGPLLETFADQ